MQVVNRDMKAGELYRVAGGLPTTARTWKRAQGLAFGVERPGHHPLYSTADAVRLMAMAMLTVRMGMAASLAAEIVNAASAKIDAAVKPSLGDSGGNLTVVVELWPTERGSIATVWIDLAALASRATRNSYSLIVGEPIPVTSQEHPR